MRSLPLIIATIVAGPALGQTGDFVSPDVVLEEFGVFCPDEAAGRVEAPDTERGFIDLIDGDPRVDFPTTVVPAELGLGFGLRFRLPDGQGVQMARVIIEHPPFGDPPLTVESYPTTVDGQYASVTQFDFDDAYEMQLGTWVMSIEILGQIVLRQTFQVVPPEQSPISARLCDGPPMMS